MQTSLRRPLGITLLSLPVLLIGCFGTLIFPLMLVGGVGRKIWEMLSPSLIHSRALGLFVSTILIILWWGGYLLYAAMGYGLWNLRPWAFKCAWWLHILGATGGLIAALSFIKFMPVLVLPIAIGLIAPPLVILWYLRRPSVRDAFSSQMSGTLAAHETVTPVVPLSMVIEHKRRPIWMYWVGGIVGGGLLMAMFIGSLFYGIDKMFRSSEVYRDAWDQTRSSPCVARQFGGPLIAKGMTEGNMSESSSEGSAELHIPVRGPKTTGNVSVSATKANGHWKIDSLAVIYGEGQIQLLPESSACQ